MRRQPFCLNSRGLAFGLGLGAGAVGGLIAGLVAGRRLVGSPRIAYLGAWQRVLARGRGEVRAAMLAARIQARYELLYARRPRFSGRAWQAHLEGGILPGLAAYQVLSAASDDRAAVMAEMEALFRARFAPARRLMSLLRYLPDPFDAFRRTVLWDVRLRFPARPGETEIVENNRHCLAINTYRCLFLDVLTAYGAPELAPLYCLSDDIIYEALPPSIAWERTQTLAQGGACCDFRWRRVASERS